MRKILSFLLMALFSVGMWAANSYWYAGNTNGYASSPMTPSEKGNYEYISLPKQGATISFKIQLASGSWDGALGRAYNVSGFAATDVTSMNSGTSAWSENTGDSWENSCIYYVDKAFYIIVFKPKSDMNTTDNPIICASTFLPEEKDEPVEIVHTVGIKGAWDDWGTTPLMETATDKKTASIVLAMTEGVYEFGLELDHGWIANGATVTRAENTQVIPGSGSNMKLTVDADGDYTFTWTFETNTLTVTYPDVVVIPAKYYLTGDSALVVDAGYDKAKAWSPSAIKVTEDTYVLSGLKAGQVYKLKATLNGEWETAKSYADLSSVAPGITKDGDDNIVFKMANDGNVTVTLKDKVFTVEGDFAMPTVAIAGNVTKWSQVPMEVAKDKLSASVTLKELAVGVDSFKIVLDGNWISKNGEGESFYTFHRTWNEDKGIKGGERNMLLNRDKAGSYTFTWVYANDSLHIAFPELVSSAVTVFAPEHGTITVKNGEDALGESVQEGTILTVAAASKDAATYDIINLRAYKTEDPDTKVEITDGKLTMPAYPITITANEEKVAYQTLYFVNKDGWETVNAYVYLDDDHKYKAWPGDAMTKTEEKAKGKDVYSYRFPAKYTKIIFNDGGENQTENHSWIAAKPYICNGLDYASAEDVVLDAKVKYYVVGNAEAMGGWDPTAVPSAAEECVIANLPAGDYKFRLSLDGTWENTKGFSDLKEPVTAGLKAGDENNICFTLKEASDVTITYSETAFTVAGKFYVRVPVLKDLMLVPGVWAEEDAKIAAWIWTKKEGHEMEDQWTAFFAPKSAGNDTLTVKLDAEADSIVFARFNSTAEAPSWEGNEDFRWNSLAGDTIDKTDLTYTIIDWNEGTWDPYIPAKYYLTGDSALVVDAGFNKDKTWHPDAIKVTEDTYVFANLKKGQEYRLKATLNGEWETTKAYAELTAKALGLKTDGDNNIIFRMANNGNVTVTLTDKVFTVEGDFAMPTVAIAGNVTGWSPVEMKLAEDKLSASVTLENLAYGVDSFKIVLDGNWISKNGEDEGFYTFHRDWNEDKDIKGGERNMILDRDNAGNYTFTWVFANDSLHIDFPAAPDTATIYFVNTNKDWTEKIYAHAFVGEKGYKEWPGVEMINTGKTVWEKAIYSAKVPVTFNEIIFNNGDAKTATYAWTKEKPFFCDGNWYADQASIPEIEPAKYYISGNAALVAYAGLAEESAWNAKAIKVTKDTFVFEGLPAGYYLMKVVTKDAEPQWLGYDQLTEKSQGLVDVEDHKVGFTMEKAGNVMVVYTDKAYVVKGDYAKLPKVGLGANFNKWNWVENLLVPAKDSLSASLKVNLGVTDTIRLKIVSDGNWLSLNGEENSEYSINRAWPKAEHVNIINDGNNFALTTDKEGDYTFTWTYADSTLTVKFPELVSYAVTVTNLTNGTITVKNGEDAIGESVQEGTVLTVTAVPNSADYEITNLRAYKTGEEGVEVAITDGKLIMPAYPITITANEEKIDYQTIYFVNYEGWETVKAFVWFESTAYKEWHGENMTKESAKVKGKDLYSYKFPSKYKKIIFNNGMDGDENKTSDLSWEAEKPYYCNGSWYATAEDVQLDPDVKYYITGNDDLMGPGCGWVDSKAFKSLEDAYVLKDLDAGVKYIMKVLVDGTGATTKNYLNLTSTEGLTTNEYNDIVFVLAEHGDVTVTYNATTFTVTGNFASTEYYIAGTFTNWAKEMVKMTEQDDTYTATIEIPAETEQQFKVVSVYGNDTIWYGLAYYSAMTYMDDTWEIGGGDAEIGLVPTKAGKYTFYFDPDGLFLKVAMPSQGGGTALDNIDVTKMAKKVIIDGQLYILHKGTIYNIQGQTVK